MMHEFQLLVACSWVPPDGQLDAQTARIAELCGTAVDWESFLSLVRRHQVPALACRTLEREIGWTIPAPVLGGLRRLAAAARTRSLLAAAECARIARALAAARIDVLPLKGGALSVELYGDPAARHSSDVDILVRDWEVDRTHKVLNELGYQPAFPSDRMTPRMRALLRRCACATTYWNPHLKIAVDLHWDQELWTRAQVEELWRRSEVLTCLGAPMRCPDSDMLLLYLCDHGAKHDWSRVKWLSDVAVLLARPRFRPWQELFDLARQMDVTGVLASSAFLVHSLYGLELPPELDAFVRRDGRVPEFVSGAMAAMRLSQEEVRNAALRQWIVPKLRKQVLRRPGLPLIEHLRKRLIHADDLCRFALPDGLLWLYYPLRPLFWIWRQLRPAPEVNVAGPPQKANQAAA
jgi:hypothetical protein